MTRKLKDSPSPDSPSTKHKGLYKRLLIQTGDEQKARHIWKKRIKEIEEELLKQEEKDSNEQRSSD